MHAHTLVDAARRGDPAAQDALLDRWRPAVLRWTASLGGPRVDAEDAAQDVLLTAWRRLPGLRDPDAVEAWLFGITRRVLAAHRRRAWFRRWVPGAHIDRASTAPSPAENAVSRDQAARVRAVLEALPRAQREVFVLCLIEQRSTSEAAALIGVPQGTVKSRLRLGRQRFAQLAPAHGIRPDPPALLPTPAPGATQLTRPTPTEAP